MAADVLTKFVVVECGAKKQEFGRRNFSQTLISLPKEEDYFGLVMPFLIFSNSSKERQQTFEIVSKGRRFAAMSFLAQDNLTSLLPSSIPIAMPLATERSSTLDNSSRLSLSLKRRRRSVKTHFSSRQLPY